jgi:hypothetical protein
MNENTPTSPTNCAWRYLTLLLLFSTLSCKPTYQLVKSYDEYTGAPILKMQGNSIDLIDAGDARLELNAVKRTSGEVEYYLQVIYTGRNPIFIRKENSLSLDINGERSSLSCAEPFVGDNSGASSEGAIEVAGYKATAVVVQKLADALKVTVKIEGKQGTLFGTLSKENIKRFKEMSRKL